MSHAIHAAEGTGRVLAWVSLAQQPLTLSYPTYQHPIRKLYTHTTAPYACCQHQHHGPRASWPCLPPSTTRHAPAAPAAAMADQQPSCIHLMLLIVSLQPAVSLSTALSSGWLAGCRLRQAWLLCLAPRPNSCCWVPGCFTSDAQFCACMRVHSFAVAMASFSLSFQCFATLSARGSSGLGALSSAWILSSTVRI